MDVELDAPAEALNRCHRPASTIDDPTSAPTTTLEAEERAGVDREHGTTEDVIPRQAIAERVRQREHPLTDRDMGQDMIDQLGGTGGHSATQNPRRLQEKGTSVSAWHPSQ